MKPSVTEDTLARSLKCGMLVVVQYQLMGHRGYRLACCPALFITFMQTLIGTGKDQPFLRRSKQNRRLTPCVRPKNAFIRDLIGSKPFTNLEPSNLQI
jgi:hypothetical protein